MGTYTVQHEDFPDLDHPDLVRYKRLSDALRNFEFVTIYNFMDKAPEDREAFTCEVIQHLEQSFEGILMMNCGPLCPRGRSCVMCRILAQKQSERPTAD